MTEQTNQKPHAPTCPCPHHKVIWWAILAVGIAYLLSAFNIGASMLSEIVTGLALVAIGGTKLYENKCTCC